VTILAALPLVAALVAGGGAAPRDGGTPEPTSTPPATTIVRGIATWYGTGPGSGHAAAGPALRAALGKGWRGTRIRVTGPSGAVVEARLTDWCACPGRRVIDLSDEDFSDLAPLSRGVIKVTISTKENR